MHEMQKASCSVPPWLSADGQEKWLCTFPISTAALRNCLFLSCTSGCQLILIWGTELESWQRSGAWNSNHGEAKLRGESSARASVQGGEISWWAFRQRAEMWTLLQSWKQCMNKILHDCSSSPISITHSHRPQGLSPEITVSTWSVQQPRQPSDPALAYIHPMHSVPAPKERRMLRRLWHRVLTCSCSVQGGWHSPQPWGNIPGVGYRPWLESCSQTRSKNHFHNKKMLKKQKRRKIKAAE